ncbi:alpha/beta hydrolase [Nordella sp. HKS 07]|uniref:alpha/beta fold hydrolase n=1 Tax=Nordella sp. HKS 07 TaxID=2712222 RepID=UPI0013E1911C|nr:alpha/beta hydrolase [Nordella sp. HKS 07]QIG51203.1 alpha/beta hydrolase [Nordella sp. HKS 07]
MRLARFALTVAAAALFILAAFAPAQAAPVKNIVIVHGALADGSGWRKVYDLLKAKGHDVTIVQEPMTSLQDDVDATHRILALQDGPVILVGHSYGGMVVTEAGNSDKVVGLVYIAAFQPDVAESVLDLAGKTPAPSTGIVATADGYLYLDPKVFAADFAADVSPADTEFMAHSQVLPAKAAFETKSRQPAWKSKKSWALITTEDRAINPDLMRMMAKRAGSTTVEVKASHAVFISQPEAVANLIEEASLALSK